MGHSASKQSHNLSIYGIYIAPLQGAPLRGAQAQAKIKVLRSLWNELDKFRGKERISDWRLFQADGPTIEKALCCLMAVRGWASAKSPLEAERRDCRPVQDEVRIKSSGRYAEDPSKALINSNTKGSKFNQLGNSVPLFPLS